MIHSIRILVKVSHMYVHERLSRISITFHIVVDIYNKSIDMA
jgi:hypothetical protein